MGLRTLLLLLLLTAPSFAEVLAVIDGPTKGIPGDLIVLNGSKSIGDGHQWVLPEGLQTLACGDIGPGQLAFASGKAGSYTFGLIVADKEAAIDYTTHTVTIGGTLPDPDPTPTPVPELEKLEKLSLELATKLADSGTAKALSAAILQVDTAIESLCSSGQCPELLTAKLMMVRAIENILLIRRSEALWAVGWREPANKAIEKLNVTDVDTYRSVMRALAAGLKGASL